MYFIWPISNHKLNKQGLSIRKSQVKCLFTKVFCLQRRRDIYSCMLSSGHRSAVSYSLLTKIPLHMLVPYLAATPYLHNVNC